LAKYHRTQREKIADSNNVVSIEIAAGDISPGGEFRNIDIIYLGALCNSWQLDVLDSGNFNVPLLLAERRTIEPKILGGRGFPRKEHLELWGRTEATISRKRSVSPSTMAWGNASILSSFSCFPFMQRHLNI